MAKQAVSNDNAKPKNKDKTIPFFF